MRYTLVVALLGFTLITGLVLPDTAEAQITDGTRWMILLDGDVIDRDFLTLLPNGLAQWRDNGAFSFFGGWDWDGVVFSSTIVFYGEAFTFTGGYDGSEISGSASTHFEGELETFTFRLLPTDVGACTIGLECDVLPELYCIQISGGAIYGGDDTTCGGVLSEKTNWSLIKSAYR